MDRRKFLHGASATSITLAAGCANSVNQTGVPEMEWEYGWEGFLDASSRTVIFVTGEIENVGSAYAEEFDLECQLLAEDGSVIASSRRRLRSFDENEEQLFYYKFLPDESEADRIDDVAVEGTFPDE